MRTLTGLLPLLAACDVGPVVDDNPGQTGDSADTADTGGEAPSNTGDYVGTAEGLYEWQGNQATCTGEATLTLADDKTFAGTADCVSQDWGTLDGPLEGSVADGVVTGTWTVYFQPDTVAQELTGDVVSGHFEVTTQYTNSFGSFSSVLALDLQ